MYCRLQLEWKYVTTHEKRDLPPHLVSLYNKPKCLKNWSQVKIQITLVLWTTILCLPCGEVSTVIRTLVCPGEAFTFHDCELFKAVIHCVQWRCGHVMSTVAMATGTTASRILEKTILSKSFIKQSYHLECMFLSLGWHWKGAKKWKKPETVVLTSSGRGHTSMTSCINGVKCGIRRCLLDNDYKQSNVFFSAKWFAGGTHAYRDPYQKSLPRSCMTL